METTVDFSREETTRGSSARSLDQHTRLEELLTIRNVGAYFYDPRLVTLTIGGTFGLTQEWFEKETDGTSDDTQDDGNVWGYEGSAHFLPEKAISLKLFASRDQRILPTQLATRTEVKTENRGGTLFARRLYIPSTLSFRQELREEETRTAATVGRRDERDNIMTYEGERGWLNSELRIRYEFIDHEDQVFPNLDYKSHEGNATYSRDFGTELNWHWDSRLRYLTRTGASELTNWTVDELLRIDHTDRLRTEYRYVLTYTDSQGSETTTHAGIFTLRHQLYESLTTTFTLDPTFERLDTGDKNMYRGRLDFDYTKRLPGQGRLNAGLGGIFAYEDDRFDATQASAVNELHTATTPFALPIALDNPFVVQSSVVVTKVTNGPPVAGCSAFSVPRTLTEGVDYTLQTTGNTTEIVPLPCSVTNPGINPGDTITVNYQFTVSPSRTFTTTSWHASVSVDYRWIRPFFVHEETEQTLVDGSDGNFLNDQMSDTVGTEFRYERGRLRANLVAEAQRFTSRDSDFNTVRSNQILTFSILPQVVLTLSGDEAFTDYSQPAGRETVILTGRANLRYTLNANLLAETFGEVRDLTDTQSLDERTTEAGLRVRWTYRQLEVRPELEFIDRQREDTDTRDYRATLHIIRRF